MKSRVLGLACAAGLAAGCQSPTATALGRWKASDKSQDDVAQVSHEAEAGLPGPSQRRSNDSGSQYDSSFAAGEKALLQFYRDKQDKPAHLQRARINFEAAAAANPMSAEAQHRLAIVADLQERYRDSENYYRTAISMAPGNAEIAADLGWSYMLQERYADAERALIKALEIQPSHPIAREHLASCRQRMASIAANNPNRNQSAANQPAAIPGYAAQPQRDSRLAAQQPQPGPRPPMAIPQDMMGEYTRQQLAAVDNYGQRPVGEPIVLAPQRNSSPPPIAQPAPDQYASQPAASSAPPSYPAQQVAATAPAPYAPRPAGNQQFFPHFEPNRAPSSPPIANDPRQQRPAAAPLAQGNGATRQEWPFGAQAQVTEIQRTQGLASPGPSDQAMFQAPQLPPLPTTQPALQANPAFPNQPRDSRTAGAPIGNQPGVLAVGGQNPLEKARRDAALMGLGIGPGQYFPSLEQPVDRAAPGTGSQFGGASYPTPPIYSPDLTPPPDLRGNPSFFQPPPVAPPTNQLGQQMPAGTSNIVTQGGWNDPQAQLPSSVAPVAAQLPQLPPPPNVWSQSGMPGGMSGYDEARRATDAQLQQTLSTTWSNSPSSAIPTPSSGVSMQRPGDPSQIMLEGWGRQAVAPPPYPHSTTQAQNSQFAPLPAVNPSPGRGASTQSAYSGSNTQPVYREGVVVPPQYQQRY